MSRKSIAIVSVFFLVALYVLRPGRVANEAGTVPADSLNALPVPRIDRPATQTASKTESTSAPFDNSRDLQRIAIEKQLDAQWQAPITFYGKVIDERGVGVSDAEVQLSWNNLSGTPNRKLRTHADGSFEFDGEQGHSLVVTVKKDGYYTSAADNRIFYYGKTANNHSPRSDDPVLFHLHKIRGAERLIQVKRNLKVKRDGTPLLLDLVSGLEGKESPESLKVECWTSDETSAIGSFDWKCRISIPGGGLLQSTNEFDFVAPPEGYLTHHQFIMSKENSETWAREAEAKFFYKTANGNYGSLSFAMIAFNDHFCMVQSFLNPTGSPNVEYTGTNAIRNPPQ
jgi:hypothetical protein